MLARAEQINQSANKQQTISDNKEINDNDQTKINKQTLGACTGADPHRNAPRSASTVNSPHQSRQHEMAGRPSLRAGTAGKGSSVRQRANATRGYNTPSRARSYLPPGAYDRQPNRSWLDTRRKVHHMTTAGTGTSPRGSRGPPRCRAKG